MERLEGLDRIIAENIAEARMLWLEALPDYAARSHTFSAAFEQKMQRLGRTAAAPRHRRWTAVAAVLALCLLSLTVARAMRRDAVETFYRYDGEELTIYQEYNAVGDGTPRGICVGYMPDGFTQVWDHTAGERRTIQYYNAETECSVTLDGERMAHTYFQMKLTCRAPVIEEIRVNDGKALWILNEKNGAAWLFWSVDNYAFTLHSTLDQPEMVRIAESVSLE